VLLTYANVCLLFTLHFYSFVIAFSAFHSIRSRIFHPLHSTHWCRVFRSRIFSRPVTSLSTRLWRCGCGADDRAGGTLSSTGSPTSSSVDSEQDSTSKWEERHDTRLHPPRSPDLHLHQPSSEWSEGSGDRTPVAPQSPSYPLPYSSPSSTADSEASIGSPPPGPTSHPRMLNVFDLPSVLDQTSTRKPSRHSLRTSG